MQIRLLHIFCCVFICTPVRGQESITLAEAQRIALENNLQIKIAGNEKEMAAIASNAGYAGMLPTVTLNGGANTGATNSYQEYANNTTQERNNAKSGSLNGNISANWVIFDGMRMFATRDKLKELEELGELRLRAIMENTIEQVTVAYYHAGWLREKYETIKNSMALYEERENLAKIRWENGKGNKTEYLQARVEKSAQYNLLQNTELEWKNALATLNMWMGRDATTAVQTSDSLSVPDYQPELIPDLNANTDLKLAEKNLAISHLEHKEITAGYSPRVSVGAGYNFLNSNSQSGFVLLNRNYGYTGLVNVSWNIFNGNITRTHAQVARMQIENNTLLQKEAELVVRESYLRAYNQYALALEQIKSETENLELARENMNISAERYREGKNTLLEVREAQKYANDIELRLSDALYNACTAEITIKRIKGELVKK